MLKLKKADKKDYKKIKQIMTEAFPREERPPFFVIKKRVKSKRSDLLSVLENGEVIGFVYLVTHKKIAYLFFLALSKNERGKGYGSKVLSEIKKMYSGYNIFLARETLSKSADNYVQRKKRYDFYVKNGFHNLPCQIREGRMTYDVMGTGETITSRQYKELVENWAGNFFLKIINMQLIEKNEKTEKKYD